MAKEQKDIQIAIIGTPAAGKTVFASVWAKRMTNRGDNNSLSKRRGWVSLNTNDEAIILQDQNNNPMPWTTFKYVDAYFQFLQSGPDAWIASTLTERRPQLSMTYHLGLKTYDIKMLDPPGHDLRTFFSPQSTTDAKDAISEYVNNSNIIFLIINLRDFFQHPVQADGTNINYAVTDTVEMYLQALAKLRDLASEQKKKRSVAVLWTAWKEYENTVNGKGGMSSFLSGLHLYDLHNLIHPINPDTYFEIKEFFVDPVAETRVADINENSDEAANNNHIRLPKKDFKSHNLEAPSEWLADIIFAIEKSKIGEEEKNTAQGVTNYGLLMYDKNPEEAFNSFKKAIELDNEYAYAYDCLAVCYWHGHGVKKKQQKALTNFKQAVALGYQPGISRLQKLDEKCSDIVKTCELDELHQLLAEAKILISETTISKERLDELQNECEEIKKECDKVKKERDEVKKKLAEAKKGTVSSIIFILLLLSAIIILLKVMF